MQVADPSQLTLTSLRKGGAAITRSCKQALSTAKILPTSLQDHYTFQHLKINPYQWGHLQIQAANNEHLSLWLEEPTKGLSGGTQLDPNGCVITFPPFPSEAGQKKAKLPQ